MDLGETKFKAHPSARIWVYDIHAMIFKNKYSWYFIAPLMYFHLSDFSSQQFKFSINTLITWNIFTVSHLPPKSYLRYKSPSVWTIKPKSCPKWKTTEIQITHIFQNLRHSQLWSTSFTSVRLVEIKSIIQPNIYFIKVKGSGYDAH